MRETVDGDPGSGDGLDVGESRDAAAVVDDTLNVFTNRFSFATAEHDADGFRTCTVFLR